MIEYILFGLLVAVIVFLCFFRVKVVMEPLDFPRRDKYDNPTKHVTLTSDRKNIERPEP